MGIVRGVRAAGEVGHARRAAAPASRPRCTRPHARARSGRRLRASLLSADEQPGSWFGARPGRRRSCTCATTTSTGSPWNRRPSSSSGSTRRPPRRRRSPPSGSRRCSTKPRTKSSTRWSSGQEYQEKLAAPGRAEHLQRSGLRRPGGAGHPVQPRVRGLARRRAPAVGGDRSRRRVALGRPALQPRLVRGRSTSATG